MLQEMFSGLLPTGRRPYSDEACITRAVLRERRSPESQRQQGVGRGVGIGVGVGLSKHAQQTRGR